MRRLAFARAVQGSNSIEGYDASLDDVAAAVEGEPTLDANEETQFALAGYRDAMTYVLQLARSGEPTVDEGLLLSLHFMMIKHDLSKNPGQWRPGDIFVRDVRHRRDRLPRTAERRCSRSDRGDACRTPRRHRPGARQGRDGAPQPRPDSPVQRWQRPHGPLPADAGPRRRSGPRTPFLQRRGVPRPQHAGLLRHPRRGRRRLLEPGPGRSAVAQIHAPRPSPADPHDAASPPGGGGAVERVSRACRSAGATGTLRHSPRGCRIWPPNPPRQLSHRRRDRRWRRDQQPNRDARPAGDGRSWPSRTGRGAPRSLLPRGIWAHRAVRDS